MGVRDGVSPLSRINETSPRNVPRPRTIAMINPQINSHNKLWNTVHAQETIEDVARLAMTVAKSLVGCPTPCSHSIDMPMECRKQSAMQHKFRILLSGSGF